MMEPKIRSDSKSNRLFPTVVRMNKELPEKSNCRELFDVPPKCQNNLTKAIEDGNMRTVRHLLDNGFDVNSASSQDSTTALHCAAWLGHMASITLMIAYQANPNAMDTLMRTPLHLAVIKGHYRVANLLIENGADCLLKGTGGFSAQQLVETFNISCCRHIMRSNLTLPMLTKATKNHLKKQDPNERVLLWLNDLDLKKLYPVPEPQDVILLDIDDKEEKDEHKGPKLPPLKALHHKKSPSDVTQHRKPSQGDSVSSHKQETNKLKEMKLTLPEKSK